MTRAELPGTSDTQWWCATIPVPASATRLDYVFAGEFDDHGEAWDNNHGAHTSTCCLYNCITSSNLPCLPNEHMLL